MIPSIEAKVARAEPISREEAEHLYLHATEPELSRIATTARDQRHPKGVATYQKMAIVNYTNVCVARCDYCAFYKLPLEPGGYLLSFDEVCDRIQALLDHGGSMVGFNGGFHPKLKIDHYATLFHDVRARFPGVEFYEMTVAEFMYVCKATRITYAKGAQILQAKGVRWVTGGGSEVLDDAFRLRHSPLKYGVAEFYEAQRALIEAGIGSTATMVIGFDETLQERMNHLERLRSFQDSVDGALPSFLCWTYKPYHTPLGGEEIPTSEYLRWLAICRIYLHNIDHIRASVLTQNEDAMRGLLFGADDFDLPTEDEVTQKAGATITHDFDLILQAAREVGYEPVARKPFPHPADLG